MTMAKVQNDTVVHVGLPTENRKLPISQLIKAGWHKVRGNPRPTEAPEPGYQWTYGAEWSVEDSSVYGNWSQTQVRQPYPSWSFVEGEGWVAPIPKPDGNFVWDEAAGDWVVPEDEEI